MEKKYDVIGTSPARVDAVDKVTGSAKYTSDFKPVNLTYGKLVTSPYAYARILSIDTSEAEKLPGVVGIITGKDVPDIRLGGYFMDRHILCKEYVRYVGDFVACVAAETEDIAKKAASLVKVEYEVLDAVFDPEESFRSDCPVMIHKDLYSYGEIDVAPESPGGGFDTSRPNQYVYGGRNIGDVEKAFEEADLIVENKYRLPRVSHCCMEPHATLVVPEADGSITVYASDQDGSLSQLEVAGAVGLDPSRVHFHIPYVGGGFGAKSGLSITPVAATLAMKIGRPVSLTQTREENFNSGDPRAAGVVYLKDGWKKDGTLIARKIRAYISGGAYSTHNAVMILAIPFGAVGSYKTPNFDCKSYGVYTNTPPTGPYRSLGSEYMVFAVERNMDIAARKLGMDRGELRLKNVLENGDIDAIGQTTSNNQSKRALLHALEKVKLNERRPPEGPWVFGKGVSLGNKFTFFGPTGTCCTCKVYPDGYIEIRIFHVEMGQGALTVDAMAAAEEFHTTTDKIRVVFCNSDICPFDMGTYCSRGTFLNGNAVIEACNDAKQQIFQIASKKMGIDPEKLDVRDGFVYENGNEENKIPFSDLYGFGGWLEEKSELIGRGTYSHPSGFDPECKNPVVFYSYGSWGIEVAVNTETGEVKLLNLDGAYDGGRIINVKAAEGQIEGAFSMGLGQALYEQVLFNDEGRIINGNYRDYKIPTFMDGPRNKDLRFEFVGEPDEEGPHGAKGMGEVSLTPVMPAVANAINDALGVEIMEMPITREKILAAIKEKKEKERV